MLANKPYIIGLTGGIGCGKSEAAAFLKEKGCAHVDADGISRALTAMTIATRTLRIISSVRITRTGTRDRA